MRARVFWLKAHLYLALTLGAFIAVLGLTGSLLVFHPQIDRWIGPAAQVQAPVRQQAGDAALLPMDELVARVEEQTGAPVGLLRYPEGHDIVARVELFDPRVNDYRVVDVDRRDGTVLGSRIWGRTFVTFLFDVHTHLLLGEGGLTLVGLLGIVMIVSIATGIYLWWPRVAGWMRALSYRRGRGWLPFNFEIHRLTGIYFTVVLLVVATAGVYIALPEPFRAVVNVVAQVSPELEHVPSKPATAGSSRATLRQVQDSFAVAAPGGRIRCIVMPQDALDSYSVLFVDRGAPENFYGESSMWVDQYSAQVLATHAYTQLSRADRFLAMQLPLHDGQYLGRAGQWIVFASGLALVLMYGTGLYLWWKRRRR